MHHHSARQAAGYVGGNGARFLWHMLECPGQMGDAASIDRSPHGKAEDAVAIAQYGKERWEQPTTVDGDRRPRREEGVVRDREARPAPDHLATAHGLAIAG